MKKRKKKKYVIFDYLRRNGQLGRTVGEFDANVKKKYQSRTAQTIE